MTTNPEKMFSFLKRIHNDFQPLAESLKFDKWYAHHRSIIVLYGSIFEYVGSCIVLVDNQLIIGVPGLLRSLIEAYVDLLNLIADATYGFHLEAGCLKE